MSDEPQTEDGQPYAKYLYLPDGRRRRCGNCGRFSECRARLSASFVYAERGGCPQHVGETKTKGKLK